MTIEAALIGELAASGLFDGAWYLDRYQDVAAAGKDPLWHYLEYGADERRWPNRWFDPECHTAGLIDYIRQGERAGCRPHRLFDPVWYRAAYGLADHEPALRHYLVNRGSGRFAPCADLFAVPLLAPYRDDPAAGIDPVAHYLDDVGEREAFPDLDVVVRSGLVEENYYLINAADVHEADADPTEHYCRHGWKEQRKPNIYFDPVWYGRTNPQVVRLQVNPLVHYILVGEAANRRPVPFFDPAWYRTAYGIPTHDLALEHYLRNRRKQSYSPTPLFDVAWYVDRFGGMLGPNRDPFAHYLLAGAKQDIDPCRGFDAARYRQANLGRPTRGVGGGRKPERHNPLVHYLCAEYHVSDKVT